ncbi:ubiquitin-conjugating enzyme E2 J1 [Electrophorus electricus]|uniref:Ubiquitin-conjugating enzyme E2 J1 n=1 Tax=Electrophorus electricus TaxID=8005 RepID=A0AAY5EX19_ELEEL|nr:ubiquitin-conjugating enzyme E2 J1 [Electrophorus electricus]
MENKYNLKSPAVKRLMKEAAELREPTEHYHAQPLEDNLFEWHFSVRGPPDSDFDGGIYHGRIVLPPEYPMKPPSIILLTPNGRFEVGKKICLSISGHHPETWQPSWSIRTALIAIIGFMPTKGEGAIGSLDYTPEERRALAKKSQDFCCEMCGCSMRTALLALSPNSDHRPADPQAQQLAQQINFKAESSTSGASRDKASETDRQNDGEESSTSGGQNEERVAQAEQIETAPAPAGEAAPVPAAPPTSRPLSPRQRRAQNQNRQQNQPLRRPTFPAFPAAAAQPDGSHTGSAVLIVLLSLALAALVFRRIYLAQEYKFDYEL